ncbi:Carboxy-terminal kinesin 2 [Aduncisulcus paluster]|uniref:Kinesin-like protein n=1 Tax=Aduncisulcus paluster TaxID=2918883 RepID=A0ABQ5KVV5_9EUKA|nr:Carboxy-terminal kinesin 2 [Aduncisulcus paluster]
MHEEIMDLKGNIRVFVRLRPVLEGISRDIPHPDDFSDIYTHFSFPDSTTRRQHIHVQHDPKVTPLCRSGEKRQKVEKFKFDRVYTPRDKQEDVGKEVSMLVTSVINGFCVCALAYGQTGSGKTYTMEGVIPRAVEKILKDTREKKGWKYTVKVKFIEIYNNTIRDLLQNSSDSDSKDLRSKILSSKEKRQNHFTVEEQSNGFTDVAEIAPLAVTTMSQFRKTMGIAASNRHVAATSMNAHSSRSHAIYRIYVNGEDSEGKRSTNGVMDLVDLAGSENIKMSGVDGAREKEAKMINLSLSTLSTAIRYLSYKQQESKGLKISKDAIPQCPSFRNSVLTQFLKGTLSGKNCKALLIINISPEDKSIGQTLASLKFGMAASGGKVVVKEYSLKK